MILLLDQNISFKLAKRLQNIFPETKHVSDLRLEGASDIEIWEYAKTNNCCIVTFDFDFIDLATLKGFPPKIIWLRMGNSSTENLESKLRLESEQIIEFLGNNETAFLEIK